MPKSKKDGNRVFSKTTVKKPELSIRGTKIKPNPPKAKKPKPTRKGQVVKRGSYSRRRAAMLDRVRGR